MNNLPESIARLTAGRSYKEESIGMSGAGVWMFEDMVLKIQPVRPWTSREREMLRWLEPAPKLLAWEEREGMAYCLMSRIGGKMACDPFFLERPELLTKSLADAMKLLWSVDIGSCPVIRDQEAELADARYRVEHGLVDVENTELDTFGPGGQFRDPAALLAWLEEHRPQPDPVLSHGDFCLPNLFFREDGSLEGFIDLGDAGVGDRWRDLALCHRSLRYNSDGTFGQVWQGVDPDELFRALGVPKDEEKLRWYLLLDELF